MQSEWSAPLQEDELRRQRHRARRARGQRARVRGRSL